MGPILFVTRGEPVGVCQPVPVCDPLVARVLSVAWLPRPAVAPSPHCEAAGWAWHQCGARRASRAVQLS